MARTYRVTLPQGFPYDSRRRAGVTVTKAEGYVGELTDDQIKEVKADPALTVKEVKADDVADPETSATPARQEAGQENFKAVPKKSGN